MTNQFFRRSIGGLAMLALAACTASPSQEAPLVRGPAIQDIVTPFDEALACLQGKIHGGLTFAVGGIPDQTGTYQNSTEGVGKFVTQGAGDIVQSALFKTGVTLINRRDMGTAALEAQWGLLDLAGQKPANFVITGSITSLDFIPGGGATLSIGGVGPKYRQNLILVGLDLAMTNTATGQILGNIALRKQIFADELGLIVGRVFDSKIVDFEVGGARREAINYALRMMLQLATYELLVQLMPAEKYIECSDGLDEGVGSITGARTSGEQTKKLNDKKAEEEAKAAAAQALADAKAAEEEAKALAEVEAIAAANAAAKARAKAEAKAIDEAEAAARLRAQAEAKEAAQAKAVAKAQADADAKAVAAAKRLAEAEATAEAKAIKQAQAEAKAREVAEAKALAAADAKAKKQAQAVAKAEAAEKAKLARQAKLDAAATAKAIAKAKSEARARDVAEAKALAAADAKAKKQAQAVAKAEAAEKAKLARQAKAEAKAKAVAEAKAIRKAKAEARARELAEAKAARAAAKAKAAAEKKAAAEAAKSQNSSTERKSTAVLTRDNWRAFT